MITETHSNTHLHHTKNVFLADTPMYQGGTIPHSSVRYQILGYSAYRGEVTLDLSSEEKFFPCIGAITGSFLSKKKKFKKILRAYFEFIVYLDDHDGIL